VEVYDRQRLQSGMWSQSRDPIRPWSRLGRIDERLGLGLSIKDLGLGIGLRQLGLVHIVLSL